MRIGDSVPGISGGTIAVIAHIYDTLIYSIRAVDLHALRLLASGQAGAAWKYINGNFLIVLALGILIGLVLSARTVLYLLDNQFAALMAFFIGLVLASSWLLRGACNLRAWPNLVAWAIHGTHRAGAAGIAGGGQFAGWWHSGSGHGADIYSHQACWLYAEPCTTRLRKRAMKALVRGNVVPKESRSLRAAGLLVCACVVLSACGNNYQAPVAEQGARQVITPPLIVNSSTPDSALRAQGGSAPVTTTTEPARAPTVAASSGTSPARTHRVSRGDTLYSIAFQYDLDFRALALANGLNPPYTILVDQELLLDSNSRGAAASTPGSNIGVAVANNSVARAQGTVNSDNGVIRQAIGSSNATSSWQWPHQGPILRSFDAQSKGIDFDGRVGEPVLAASAGDVVYSGRGIQGAGELIILRHGDRYLSAYSHNSAMLVQEGDRVQAGQQIAELGQNPAGTPMLHFEIRVDGKSVDPAELLPRR